MCVVHTDEIIDFFLQSPCVSLAALLSDNIWLYRTSTTISTKSSSNQHVSVVRRFAGYSAIYFAMCGRVVRLLFGWCWRYTHHNTQHYAIIPIQRAWPCVQWARYKRFELIACAGVSQTHNRLNTLGRFACSGHVDAL